MHRYLAGEDDRRKMLDAVGCASVEELLASIPQEVRCGALDLPPAASEEEVRRQFWAYAIANSAPECFASFLGAGVYRHIAPAVADAMLQRGEFFTAYTPYQPEVSQGTLQAVFEFQTFVCQLTQLDVANASLYDGATAVVEAVMMAARVLPKRRRVVVAGAFHPDWSAVLDTYCEPMGLAITRVGWGADGRVDGGELAGALGNDVCAVVVQSPNFLGVVEDLSTLGPAIAGSGALGVHAVAEATSLGLLAPGGRFGFDVVCGEMQAFGLPAAFGGPLLGFFATKQAHVRQMPGRLVGETLDSSGRRGFVLTLSTREQHIRRAKATSNICTNTGLMALAFTINMCLLGKSGFKRLASLNLAKAEYAKTKLAALRGFALRYSGPTFNELTLRVRGGDACTTLERLADRGIFGGVAMGEDDTLVIAVTERNRREDIDALARALEEVC